MSEHNPKALRWLYRQLPDLVSAGILNEEQARRLRDYYGPAPERPYSNLSTIVIGILGTLLVGGGIILIVAYNWDDLSRGWRTVLSFAPLVLAQAIYAYAFFRRRDDPAWVEGASTFLFLMIGATLALVSQTYHITGTMGEYLLSWALLSIPVMYLMNASLPAVLYLVGIAWWVTHRQGNEGVYYWGLLLAAVPHLVRNFHPARSPLRRNLLGWTLVLTMFFAWWWVVETGIRAYSFIGTALVLADFYLLGQVVFAGSHTLLTRPFRTASVVGTFIFLLVLTFPLDLEPNGFAELFNGDRYAPWAARVNLLVLLGLFGAYVYLLLSRFRPREPVAYALWFFPFLVVFYNLIGAGGANLLAQVAANAYTLAFGLAFLVTGLQRQQLGRVNVGLLFILLLAAVRFFDTDWSYIVKGVAFVLLGLGFLTANLMLSRRLKTARSGERGN